MISYPTILDFDTLHTIKPQFDVLSLISRDLARKSQTCVLAGEKKQIHLITTNNDPASFKTIFDMLGSQGYKITTHYTDHQSFELCLGWYDEAENRSSQRAQELHKQEIAEGEDAIVLMYRLFEERQKYSESDFINEIMKLSYQAGASDLHFQNEEKAVVLRLRIDGILHDTIKFDHQEFKKYLFKIKFMSHAKMNIDYLPQDARFTLSIRYAQTYRTIDVRLSLIPGLDGESVAMRFLDPLKGLIDLKDIGFLPSQQDLVNRVLDRMSGMVIITGPTGSGKTTTLYSMIKAIDHSKYKIITLEDPIEYHLEGIQQSQIDEYRGYSFETGLKAILRHDPDVIMVGEIRTLETAETAIAAAMTGHLVLCTLHTNSAIEAIQRLVNMGIKPYTLIGALNVIVSQKLIHKVKPGVSARPMLPEQAQIIQEKLAHWSDSSSLSLPSSLVLQEDGEDIYQGRLMVAEVLHIDETVKQMILQSKSSQDIEHYALRHGYITIADAAMIAMFQHQTSWNEFVRLI